MKSFIKFFIFALFALVPHAASAADVAAADSAYAKGNYAEAVKLYSAVAESEGISSELLYNLGNAYAKSGDYGHAMVNYLRALRLDPSNSGAADNISYIESKVADSNRTELKGKKLSIEPEGQTFFSAVKGFICRDHLADTWSVWAVVLFLLFVGCLVAYIFTHNVLSRKIGFFGGIVFFGFSVVAIVFSFMAASYTSNEGVVTGAKVRLRSEASVTSKENAVALTRGTRLWVLDSFPADADHPQWYKVRLNSDFIGWIESSDFETVGM